MPHISEWNKKNYDLWHWQCTQAHSTEKLSQIKESENETFFHCFFSVVGLFFSVLLLINFLLKQGGTVSYWNLYDVYPYFDSIFTRSMIYSSHEIFIKWFYCIGTDTATTKDRQFTLRVAMAFETIIHLITAIANQTWELLPWTVSMSLTLEKLLSEIQSGWC